MTGARSAVVEAALTVTETLVSGLILVIFILAWFGIAFLRVILGLPGALAAARNRPVQGPVVMLDPGGTA